MKETHTDDPAAFLGETEYLNLGHPLVRSFAQRHAGTDPGASAKAISLYYAIRDEIRYDPYAIRTGPDTYKASYSIEKGRGFCIQKSAAYAAVCRVCGIPARVGYADVRNHLATERLLKLLETNIFIYHGYVEVYLEGRWVKATPVFNLSLCEKFQVLPLEFDGRTDSLFHPFDAGGQQHMEYVRDRGTRDDVPVDEINAAMTAAYPRYFKAVDEAGDFEAEAAALGHSAGNT